MQNPYPGVNAHLNSLLQTPGTPDQPALWHAFHGSHITHMADALNAQLPLKYVAYAEQSLQLRDVDQLAGVQYREPDMSIFQRSRGDAMTAAAPVEITWQRDIALPELKPVRAVVIRETADQSELGRVVARIELLSPANKRRGRTDSDYQAKRYEGLRSGVPLVEIDYLHEQAPILDAMPRYPQDEGSYPYWVVVTTPSASADVVRVEAVGWRVSDAIKRFAIPLAGDERLIFDLTPIYHHTFVAGRWHLLLDYTALPRRVATYRADDRAAIAQVMQAVQHRP